MNFLLHTVKGSGRFGDVTQSVGSLPQLVPLPASHKPGVAVMQKKLKVIKLMLYRISLCICLGNIRSHKQNLDKEALPPKCLKDKQGTNLAWQRWGHLGQQGVNIYSPGLTSHWAPFPRQRRLSTNQEAPFPPPKDVSFKRSSTG